MPIDSTTAVELRKRIGSVLGADLGGRISDSTTAVWLARRLGGRLADRISDSTAAVALGRRLGGVLGADLGVEFRILPPQSGSRRVLGTSWGQTWGSNFGFYHRGRARDASWGRLED